MKMIINACYGGYGVSDEAQRLCNFVNADPYDRCDPFFISLVEERGSDFCSDDNAKLKVIEIPDKATDYEIEEYDGYENIIYVLDGKICHLY